MLKTIGVFSLLILSILLLLQLSQFYIFSGDIKLELLLSLLAIAFFFIGVYYKSHIKQKKSAAVEISVDYNTIKRFNISDREYEVLQKLALNMTNKEIAEVLFVSESTIKSHVGSLLKKLSAKNRYDIVQKAINCNLLNYKD